MSPGNSLFISYSHKDKAWLARLKRHLRPLDREDRIDCWDDTRITPGDEWRREIETALGNARIAILLVSADFYASDFIAKEELPPLLEKAKAAQTRILVLVVGPCRYQRDATLNRYQSVHDPALVLSAMQEHQQEAIFDQLAAEVEKLLGPAGNHDRVVQGARTPAAAPAARAPENSHAQAALRRLQAAPELLAALQQVGSSRVDLQACKLEYSIVSPK